MPGLRADFRSKGDRNDKETTCSGEGHVEGEVMGVFARMVWDISDFRRS